MSTEDTVTDILIPTFSDKEPIIWDDNNASLEGVLYEVKQYLVRKNLFAPLLLLYTNLLQRVANSLLR